MKKQTNWHWYAWGKHPGMEDFVWAGTQTQLFKRFTKWVDNGFARINANSELRSRHCSWRFWTKGTGGQVVCGLVRNSCDAHGRSFPMLYIGAGDLKYWANNCSMLPFAFESTWKSFEYAASARVDTIQQLNDSLQLIQQPLPEWRKFQQRIYDASEYSNDTAYEEIEDSQRRLIIIDCDVPENLPYDWQFCKRVMAMDEDQAPLAVFIGAVDERVGVAVMNHTLTPGDFAWLWGMDTHSEVPPRPYETERMRWRLS